MTDIVADVEKRAEKEAQEKWKEKGDGGAEKSA
jgi:hypothetical protein